MPAALAPQLAAPTERIFVVLASRTGAGPVLGDTDAFPGSGRDRRSHGQPCQRPIVAVASAGRGQCPDPAISEASGRDRPNALCLSAKRRGAEGVSEATAPDHHALILPEIHAGRDPVVLVALVGLQAAEADEVVVEGVTRPVRWRD
jgi:hypothetical protein